MARRRSRAHKSGLSPGSPVYMGEERSHAVGVEVIDFHGEQLHRASGLDKACGPPRRDTVRWVDVDGVHDVSVVSTLGERFALHPLAIEDILNPASRPKTEEYDTFVLLIIKHLSIRDTNDGVEVVPEQVSIALGKDYLLTFQELPGDSFTPVRKRLCDGRGRLRTHGADYLAYAIIDATVDRYFEVLERLVAAVEELEQEVLLGSPKDLPQRCHRLRQQHGVVRKQLVPLAEAVGALQRGGGGLVHPETQLFLRDVRDHLAQLTDQVENSRDVLVALLDTWAALDSQRQGEINKALTVVATVFLPLTFIVGVYGQNFDNIPELHWKYGYFIIWGVMLAIALGLRLYFKYRRWV